jgi:phosphoribosyl-AMP cyclohydrolase
LLKVDQQGPACHTGRRSCFYLATDAAGARVATDPLVSPDDLYGRK